VTIVKHARYLPDDTSGDASSEVDILARIDKNLHDAPLAGFVAEGSALVMALIQTGKIDAIVGVSCLSVLERAFPYMEAAAIPGIAH